MNISKIKIGDNEEMTIRDLNLLEIIVDVRHYGAKLDGITDDTDAFTLALAVGSVKLPYGKTVVLNNLKVPDFRTIDFNGCLVKTESFAIKNVASSLTGYIRNISVKNAHFITPNISGSPDNSYGGIYLDGAIKCIIDNCELANAYDGCELAYIRNSFNITLRDVYCGTGNSVRTTARGIVFYCGEPIISGSDNITNCCVENLLFQNIKNGIVIEYMSGLFDSNVFKNIGFSNCGHAIYTVGEISSMRNTTVDTLRVEFSDNGVLNNGYMSLNNIYFTRISGYCIKNNGFMCVSGNVQGYNPSNYAVVPFYDNVGELITTGTHPTFMGRMNVANSGVYEKPRVKGFNTSVFIEYYNNAVLSGNTPTADTQFFINYPDGFNKFNTVIDYATVYKLNLQMSSKDIVVSLSTDYIVVDIPSGDLNVQNRPYEIKISLK